MSDLTSFEADAARFDALSDRSRLAILALLQPEKDGLIVSEIVAGLGGLSQPTVSHHIGILQRAGLVTKIKNIDGSRTTVVKLDRPNMRLVSAYVRGLASLTPGAAAELLANVKEAPPTEEAPAEIVKPRRSRKSEEPPAAEVKPRRSRKPTTEPEFSESAA